MPIIQLKLDVIVIQHKSLMNLAHVGSRDSRVAEYFGLPNFHNNQPKASYMWKETAQRRQTLSEPFRMIYLEVCQVYEFARAAVIKDRWFKEENFNSS